MKIDVLGTTYEIVLTNEIKEPLLKDCNGFCDKTTKRIVVDDCKTNCNLDKPEWFIRKCIRHEIVHAFLFESGLQENWQHREYGQEETTVDWIAVQFPKMIKAMKEADCLED